MIPVSLPEEGRAAQQLQTALSVLSVLRRRWIVVLAVVLQSMVLAALLVSSLTPQWHATATLLIHAHGPQVLDRVRGVNETELPSESSYARYAATQRELIRSRRVAEEVLENLHLARDPVLLDLEAYSDDPSFESRLEEIDPVEKLLERVQITEIRNSQVMRIRVEYPDAEGARELANEIAAAYLGLITEDRVETGSEAHESIAEERTKARRHLEASESALDAYMQKHRITSISLGDRQNLIAQNIATLNEHAKDAENARYEAQALYNQAKTLHHKGELSSAALVPGSERVVLDTLLGKREDAMAHFESVTSRYGEKHPKYQRALAQLELISTRLQGASSSVLTSLRARRDAAVERHQKLQGSVDREQGRALALGGLEPEYRALEREKTAAMSTYQVLARREAELEVTNRVDIASRPPVEMLDRATAPREPARPRISLILGAAFIVSLVLGAIAAMVMEFQDHRIRGLPELSRALARIGLRALGHLPVIDPDPQLGGGNLRGQRRRRDFFAHSHPTSALAERCRAIRAAISFTLKREDGIALLVTSPLSGEGKSSAAINLALSFAQANRRVLLVDADMRRPRLHQTFVPRDREERGGLAAVLEDGVELETVVQSYLPGLPSSLSVLCSGTPPESPAELLEGTAIAELLVKMRERYQVIIFDSPPILPVVDPVILAPHMDGVVILANAKSTARSTLFAALEILAESNSNLLGVILNEVGPDQGPAGYEYGYTESGRDPQLHASQLG